ncbi:FecR family protein [Ochrobactrum sp. S46]|nr:FecR family protein [Ochrobactrum sp. S45]MBK0046328.1 FecR family protein [Ochrobactrum sp. S46]
MGRKNSDDKQTRDEGYAHSDPVVDAALDWFTRLRNVEPDDFTRQQFETWLKADPRHLREFRTLEEMWGSKPFVSAVASLNAAPLDAPILQHYPLSRRSRWVPQALAAAAIVFVTVGVWQLPNIRLKWQADYVSATGEKTTVTLPDGSIMILNTASAVSLHFEDGRRTVNLLQGEAFFDVQHDAEHPFRVAGGYGDVKVKGTAFSVRRTEEETEVVLERGHVDVSCLCDGDAQAELRPGQSIVATSRALSPIQNVDAQRKLAWREGRIIFDNIQLGTVLDELRRYYRGKVLVTESRINKLVVTGSYRLDNIEGAIRTLADAAGVSMTRIPGGIIILR